MPRFVQSEASKVATGWGAINEKSDRLCSCRCDGAWRQLPPFRTAYRFPNYHADPRDAGTAKALTVVRHDASPGGLSPSSALTACDPERIMLTPAGQALPHRTGPAMLGTKLPGNNSNEERPSRRDFLLGIAVASAVALPGCQPPLEPQCPCCAPA